MTNDDIDRAIRESWKLLHPESNADRWEVSPLERDAFRAGVAAGLEAAAKECRPILRSMVSRSEIAVAILALKVEGEHE